jgi:hypothetical protein
MKNEAKRTVTEIRVTSILKLDWSHESCACRELYRRTLAAGPEASFSQSGQTML